MGPAPVVAATRLAVRRSLAGLGDGTVLVACSGGADSLALAAAVVFEARAEPWRVVGVVVDHGLQDGSEQHTMRVVAQLAQLGCDETASIRVRVDAAAGIGVEAAAREARYAALTQLAEHFGADTVLLGHTLDDQAETVLLGLARGSGGRSIAGMRAGFEVFRRPFLSLTRTQTEAACQAQGISFWVDPHNSDPRFLRARIRHSVMPVLEEHLGPGVAAALARTADSVREDVDALDERAEAIFEECDGSFGVALLLAQSAALRRRLLRLGALAAGALPSELSRERLLAVEELVTHWRGQGRIELPGHVSAIRVADRLIFERTH